MNRMHVEAAPIGAIETQHGRPAESFIDPSVTMGNVLPPDEREQFIIDNFERIQAVGSAAVYKLLGRSGSDIAEEQAQEALIKVWRKFDPEKGELAPWVAAVTRNAMIDRKRYMALRPTTEFIDFEDSKYEPLVPTDSEPLEERINDGTELERLIADILRKNSYGHAIAGKMAVLKLVAEGFDSTECANILNIPKVSVRTRLHYIRRQLAAHADVLYAFVNGEAYDHGNDTATPHPSK